MINTGWELERMNEILVSIHAISQRLTISGGELRKPSRSDNLLIRCQSSASVHSLISTCLHIPWYKASNQMPQNQQLEQEKTSRPNLTQVDMYVCKSMPFENLPQLEVKASAIRHLSDLLRSSVTVRALTHASRQLFVPSKQPNLPMLNHGMKRRQTQAALKSVETHTVM